MTSPFKTTSGMRLKAIPSTSILGKHDGVMEDWLLEELLKSYNSKTSSQPIQIPEEYNFTYSVEIKYRKKKDRKSIIKSLSKSSFLPFSGLALNTKTPGKVCFEVVIKAMSSFASDKMLFDALVEDTHNGSGIFYQRKDENLDDI